MLPQVQQDRFTKIVIQCSLILVLILLSSCGNDDSDKVVSQSSSNSSQSETPAVTSTPKLSGNCLSGCDKIYQEEKNKLNAIHAEEKKTLLLGYKEREIELIEQDQSLQRAQKRSYAELLEPNAELSNLCQLLHEQVLKAEKSIAQEIEKLSLPDTDYDQQLKVIEGLKKQSEKEEKEWRECRDSNLKNLPNYGERQKEFLNASKRWAAASIRINELKDERRLSLEAQEQSQKLDFDWLGNVHSQCKETGEWSARIGTVLPENCACTIKQSLGELASVMQRRQQAEKDFYTTMRELDRAWLEINAFLKNKSVEMTPTVTQWIGDGVSLAIDANMILYDHAAFRNLDSDSLIAFIGTGVAKGVKKGIKTGFKSITKSVVRNRDFIGTGPKWVQKIFLEITDLQFVAANQLEALVSMREEEQQAWQSLLSLRCVQSACAASSGWFDKNQYQQLLENIHGATDESARRDFVSRAFGETGPYNQGLLATGRFCDLCASLTHIMKLRVYTEYARSVHGRTEQHIYEYQQAYMDTVKNMITYLDDANKGVVNYYLGKYELAYTITTIGVGFWFPGSVMAISATQAVVDNWSNVSNTVPFAKESAATLRSLSQQMDDKHIDLIYWRNYARNLDGQLGYLIERLSKCAARECENPSKPINIPKDEGMQCEATHTEPKQRYPVSGLTGCYVNESCRYNDTCVTTIKLQDQRALATMPYERNDKQFITIDFEGRVEKDHIVFEHVISSFEDLLKLGTAEYFELHRYPIEQLQQLIGLKESFILDTTGIVLSDLNHEPSNIEGSYLQLRDYANKGGTLGPRSMVDLSKYENEVREAYPPPNILLFRSYEKDEDIGAEYVVFNAASKPKGYKISWDRWPSHGMLPELVNSVNITDASYEQSQLATKKGDKMWAKATTSFNCPVTNEWFDYPVELPDGVGWTSFHLVETGEDTGIFHSPKNGIIVE